MSSSTQLSIWGQDASKNASLWSSPAQDAATVVKSDTTILTITKSDTTTAQQPTRGLYVGGAGDVAVRMWYSQHVVTFPSVPAGSVLPVTVDRVMSTNTTATNIVALF